MAKGPIFNQNGKITEKSTALLDIVTYFRNPTRCDWEFFVQCGVLSFTRRSLELAVEQRRRSNFLTEVNSSRKVWGFCLVWTKLFFERSQMWLPKVKNICIVMTANSTDKTWHHMDVATLPAKQVFSSFSKTLNIRYTLMDCYSVDWCTLDLQKKLICNRGDTYWSITAGSRQGSLAKPLSLLFLTPRPALCGAYCFRPEGCRPTMPSCQRFRFVMGVCLFMNSYLIWLDFWPQK